VKKSSAIAEMAAECCIRRKLDSLGYIFVADSMGHFFITAKGPKGTLHCNEITIQHINYVTLLTPKLQNFVINRKAK